MEDTKTGLYRRTYAKLQSDASTILSHWKEIAEYACPDRGEYLFTNFKQQEGKKNRDKIINCTPEDAGDIIAAGLQTGMTSPSKPWFALKHADEDLMDYAPVKNWVHDVRNIMLIMLEKSNFYGANLSMNGEIVNFGTGAMLGQEDWETLLRWRPFTIGEYFLTLDSRYRPNGLYRRFEITVRQLVQEFGTENLSQTAKSLYNNKNYEQTVVVIHCISPNLNRLADRLDYKGQRYLSTYFEEAADQDLVLSEKGFKSRPFIAPRWRTKGTNTWGVSPCMGALGDIKMLQKLEEKKLKALDKMVDPPMNAPVSMKGKGGTLVSGGINFVDFSTGGQGFTPTYQVNPDMQNIAFEIDRVEKRIRNKFFNDLFMSLLREEKVMTAREVAGRFEEKISIIGPALDNLRAEGHDLVLERTYNIGLEMNAFPPAPPELVGQELKITYISLLSQAQKMVGISAVEDTANFVGGLMKVNPAVGDKIDWDEMVDQYADMKGAPPKIIRSDEAVANMRAQQQQMQQQQQALANASAAAKGTKDLSQAEMGTGSALDSLLQSMGK